MGFNTQPPEGGWHIHEGILHISQQFQHTAARRRLEGVIKMEVETLSFNTQPPEGGWGFNVYA